jgi:DNA repair protein RecN (Recombination protein N)
LEELDQELKLLTNSETIKGLLSKSAFELAEGESPLVQQLKAIANRLQICSTWHPALPDLVERLLSAQIEISDITAELEMLNDHIQYDERRIERINERISTGYKLLKKHGVQLTSELLTIKERLAEKLQRV